MNRLSRLPLRCAQFRPKCPILATSRCTFSTSMQFRYSQSLAKPETAASCSTTSKGSTLDNLLQDNVKQESESEFVQGRLFIKFTCKICSTDNHKFMSKHAYEKGVVIIRCDGCSNLHLFADHLGWFDSQKPPGTIEDILKESGRHGDIKRLQVDPEFVKELPENAVEGMMEFTK